MAAPLGETDVVITHGAKIEFVCESQGDTLGDGLLRQSVLSTVRDGNAGCNGNSKEILRTSRDAAVLLTCFAKKTVNRGTAAAARRFGLHSGQLGRLFTRFCSPSN